MIQFGVAQKRRISVLNEQQTPQRGNYHAGNSYNTISSNLDDWSPLNAQEFEIAPSNDTSIVRIRDIPVVNSQFKEVWQRMYSKIRVTNMVKRLGVDINRFGAMSRKRNICTSDFEGMFKRLEELSGGWNDLVEVHESIPRCMLHPNHTPKLIWNIILINLLFYTATVTPYKIAFIEAKPWEPWFVLDFMIDILFFIDVCINWMSAYHDADGRLITNRKKIIMNYLKSWMLIDLVAWIPFSFIQEDESASTDRSSGGYNSLLRLVRLPRLYRLLKISRVIKMLRIQRDSYFVELIQEKLHLRQSAVRIVSSIFTVFICLHIISWFWYFSAKLDGFGPDTWVYRGGYMDEDNGQLYYHAFYWALTTLSTVGYGDIVAETLIERFLAMFWMIFGVVFFSFTIGNLSTLLQNINSKEVSLTEKLVVIDEFSKEAHLKPDLKKKLSNAVRYSVDKQGLSWQEKIELFDELPRILRYEVSMAMYQGALREIPFFINRDPVFVSTVAIYLTPIFVWQGDTIYKVDDYADQVYFINNGRVNYVYSEHLIVYKSLQQGAYFGEVEVIMRTNRHHTLMAAHDWDLFFMPNKILFEAMNDFPKIGKEIKDIAEIRDRICQKSLTEVTQLIKMKNDGEFDWLEGRELRVRAVREEDTEAPQPSIDDPSMEYLLQRVNAVETGMESMEKRMSTVIAKIEGITSLYKNRPVGQHNKLHIEKSSLHQRRNIDQETGEQRTPPKIVVIPEHEKKPKPKHKNLLEIIRKNS